MYEKMGDVARRGLAGKRPLLVKEVGFPSVLLYFHPCLCVLQLYMGSKIGLRLFVGGFWVGLVVVLVLGCWDSCRRQCWHVKVGFVGIYRGGVSTWIWDEIDLYILIGPSVLESLGVEYN